MLKRKSIVLSDIENNTNKKAVLTLEEDGFGLRGTVRLYNFSHELNGISTLGFYVDKKVHKAGLTLKSNMLYEFFIELKEIPNKFSCAVVNFQNAISKPILYGSSEGGGENIYGEIISEMSKHTSFAQTKNVLDKYGVDFDVNEKEEIEEEIDKAMCNNDCANCVYKKYFFENQSALTSAQQKREEERHIVEEISKGENSPERVPLFIEKIMPQIDRLFERNPIENNLQNLIPDSKWVKVDYEDDGDFFVFGLLYDHQDNIKYVCYGVPAVFEYEPPQELSGFPIWLPLDKNNTHGFGYWLTYQDATTGEPVKAIMD